MPTVVDLLENFEFGDDVETFRQILEMDEGDSHEFSKSIVYGHLQQSPMTLDKMNEAIKAKDLRELSSLGRFLEGSSKTLGFTLMKDECEKIKNWDGHRDETGEFEETDEAKLITLCVQAFTRTSSFYQRISDSMELFYARVEAGSSS